jgi:cobalt-zinc-cadmium efflux system membrane fusion protein
MRQNKIKINGFLLLLGTVAWLFVGCSTCDDKKVTQAVEAHAADGHAHTPGDDHQHDAGETGMHQHLHVKPEIIKKWGLQYDNPESRDYVEKITLTGVVKENKDTTYFINAQKSGIVSEVRKDIGDSVRKGEVLCLLKSSELLALKKNYIEAFQNYRLNEENYQRAQKLYKIKAIEKKEFINRETAYKSAMAEYFSIESELTIVGYTLLKLKEIKAAIRNNEIDQVREFLAPYYYILSPAAGIVINRELSLGEHIETEKMIFKIADTRKVWAVLDAMEKFLPYIKKGKEVSVFTDGYPKELFKGKVTNISENVDRVLRTVKIRVEVDNRRGLLKQEMFVKGKLGKVVKKDYLSISEKALVKLSGIDGVFIIDTDGFLFKPVQVIDIDSNGFAFLRGLNKEDMVITKGAFYLKAEHEIQSGGTDPHAGHTH